MQLGGYADFYILLFSRVFGLMRFRDESDKGLASHFEQVSEK
jgi:hypothetical protein